MNALRLQLGWALLAALWNVAGVVQIGRGMRAPGPTASLATAAILVALALVLWMAAARVRWLYLLLSVAGGLLALLAVVNAFTADPALWPSTFWRLAGAALNAFGVLGAGLAVLRRR